MPYVDKVKSVKKHWGFPTKVSDMARNMKMELHTFSPILYQSKRCGHRIHVLFMMYDVYWYCQMKKKRMIMKILKKEWFIWKFEKRGDSREKGGGGNEIHAPSALLYCISRKNVDTEYTYYSWCMTSTDIVKWRKNEWLWKFWKRNDLYENLKKGGIVEKRGEEETKSMPQVPVG